MRANTRSAGRWVLPLVLSAMVSAAAAVAVVGLTHGTATPADISGPVQPATTAPVEVRAQHTPEAAGTGLGVLPPPTAVPPGS